MKTLSTILLLLFIGSIGLAQIKADSMPVVKPQIMDSASIVKPSVNVEQMPVAIPQLTPNNNRLNPKLSKKQNKSKTKGLPAKR